MPGHCFLISSQLCRRGGHLRLAGLSARYAEHVSPMSFLLVLSTPAPGASSSSPERTLDAAVPFISTVVALPPIRGRSRCPPVCSSPACSSPGGPRSSRLPRAISGSPGGPGSLFPREIRFPAPWDLNPVPSKFSRSMLPETVTLPGRPGRPLASMITAFLPRTSASSRHLPIQSGSRGSLEMLWDGARPSPVRFHGQRDAGLGASRLDERRQPDSLLDQVRTGPGQLSSPPSPRTLLFRPAPGIPPRPAPPVLPSP